MQILVSALKCSNIAIREHLVHPDSFFKLFVPMPAEPRAPNQSIAQAQCLNVNMWVQHGKAAGMALEAARSTKD